MAASGGVGSPTDRSFGSHATTLVLVAGGSVAALIALSAGITGPSLWLIVIVLGVCSLGWNGDYMALITDRASAGGLGRATGRGLTAIYGGVAVLPPLLGIVRDATDSWATVWLVATRIVVVGATTLAASPRRAFAVGVERASPVESAQAAWCERDARV